MRVVKAGFEIINEKDVLKKVELVGRTCYKSEDRITEFSALPFCEGLKGRRHYAMFEHAALIYRVSEGVFTQLQYVKGLMETFYWHRDDPKKIGNMNRVRLTHFEDEASVYHTASGNIRAWVELFEFIQETVADGAKDEYMNGVYLGTTYLYGIAVDLKEKTRGLFDFTGIWKPDMVAMSSYSSVRAVSPEELTPVERMVHEIFTVRFIVDRGVSHELVRMRDCSFAQESTRYCNYAKGKYGKEITVVKPPFFEEDDIAYCTWEDACLYAERSYLYLVDELGVPAQMARSVLPHSTKVDIVVTANLAEWRHVFELRACDKTGKAHPQMKEVMVPLLDMVQAEGKYDFAFGDLLPAK